MYQDCFFFQGLTRISSFLLRNPCYAFCWSSETNTNNDNLSTHLFVWIINKARASFLLMWEARNTIKSWFWSHNGHCLEGIKGCLRRSNYQALPKKCVTGRGDNMFASQDFRQRSICTLSQLACLELMRESLSYLFYYSFHDLLYFRH